MIRIPPNCPCIDNQFAFGWYLIPINLTFLTLHSLGSSNGVGGCTRHVYFITNLKYFNSRILVSSTYPFSSKILLTSIRTFSISIGFFTSSDITQSIIVDEVSLPALNIGVRVLNYFHWSFIGRV